MKIISICLLLALSSTAFAAAKEVTVTADTVNVNANTINILSSNENSNLYSQYVHPWWINVGGGLTTGFSSKDSTNPGFAISVNVQPTQHQMLTLRSVGADFIGGDFYDAGLLYGLISRNRNGYVSGAAGISAVFFDSSFRKDQDISPTTVGIPLEIQAFWTPVPNFGLGIINYANINSQRSFYGAVIAIQLANLIPF